jgi:hypothetical protein
MAYTPGKGTLLKLKISSSYTSLGQVTKITPPSMEMGTVETTTITSASRSFLATIIDGGEVGFTIEWDATDTTHAALLTAFNAGTLSDFEVLFNDGGTTVQFFAIVTKFPWDEIDVESVVTIPITLKISGDVTVTPTS